MYADFLPRSFPPPAAPAGPPARPAFVTAVALAAPRVNVFRLLADIEMLPRWAAPFCERVDLTGGRWVALTILGELECTLTADEPAGAIALRLGGTAARPEWLVPLRVVAAPGGGTAVTLTLTGSAGAADAQFVRLNGAWLTVLRGLALRFGAGAAPRWQPPLGFGVRAFRRARLFNLGEDRRRAA